MPFVTSFERYGRKVGRQEGLELGLEQGLKQGLQQGLQQGHQQGLQQGHQRGQAAMLAEVLAARFGKLDEATRLRVGLGSPEQLLAWGRKAASAAGLSEVFGD